MMKRWHRLFLAGTAILIVVALVSATNQLQLLNQYREVNNLVSQAQESALNFDYDDAIETMNIAIALQPENPELYRQRGDIIMLLYEWDRALADYEHAMALASEYAPAYFSRGVLWYTQSERVKAQSDFEQYLQLVPNGERADEARNYINSIETEIEALNN